MPAFLSWVDYSSAERQRMRRAVALFSEKEARDELGLASIRDAISNALFPGTSVIQTRLRYALFIPWIYRELERNKRAHAANVSGWARVMEIGLIDPLLKAEDTDGIIGRRAKGTLQRLPSSVYWLGLQTWGIFQQGWSIDEYHRSWNRMREAARSSRSADDHGVALDGIQTWSPYLPAPPEDFPNEASFRLQAHEAEFLQERIRESCRTTLLGHAVDATGTAAPHLDGPTPWDAFQNKVAADLTELLTLARKFSVLMNGAARMYNLTLARRSQTFSDKASEHHAALLAWHDEAESEGVAAWNLDELWAFALGRANVTPRTRQFIETWQQLYREVGAAVSESAQAARLVEQREWQLKGNRSRFRNPRALEVWGGESGTGRMNYRWGTVSTLLGDLYDGLMGGEA